MSYSHLVTMYYSHIEATLASLLAEQACVYCSTFLLLTSNCVHVELSLSSWTSLGPFFWVECRYWIVHTCVITLEYIVVARYISRTPVFFFFWLCDFG